MNIALDYDGTITPDPELWKFFIARALDLGHKIDIVTMRFPGNELVEVKEFIGDL